MALDEKLKGKLRIPVVGAPLFIVSGPELVISQCKAGIIGSFLKLNARTQEVLSDWIVRIKEELDEHNQNNPGDYSTYEISKEHPYPVNGSQYRWQNKTQDQKQKSNPPQPY